MEPIAVNHITVDRELFAESHEAVFSVRRRKMLLYCGVVFLAFGLIFLALRERLPVAASLAVPALLSGALVLIWALGLRQSELKRKYRAFRRVNGESSPRTVRCYRDYLTVDTGRGEPVRIDYADVREHRETRRLCMLICGDHRGVMLARDGFETGSWQEVLDAIEKSRQAAADALLLG